MNWLQDQMKAAALSALKEWFYATATTAWSGLLHLTGGPVGLLAVVCVIVFLLALGSKVVKAVLRPSTLMVSALAVLVTLHLNGGLGRFLPPGLLPATTAGDGEGFVEVEDDAAEEEPQIASVETPFVPPLTMASGPLPGMTSLPVSSPALPPIVHGLGGGTGTRPATGHAGGGGAATSSSHRSAAAPAPSAASHTAAPSHHAAARSKHDAGGTSSAAHHTVSPKAAGHASPGGTGSSATAHPSLASHAAASASGGRDSAGTARTSHTPHEVTRHTGPLITAADIKLARHLLSALLTPTPSRGAPERNVQSVPAHKPATTPDVSSSSSHGAQAQRPASTAANAHAVASRQSSASVHSGSSLLGHAGAGHLGGNVLAHASPPSRGASLSSSGHLGGSHLGSGSVASGGSFGHFAPPQFGTAAPHHGGMGMTPHFGGLGGQSYARPMTYAEEVRMSNRAIEAAWDHAMNGGGGFGGGFGGFGHPGMHHGAMGGFGGVTDHHMGGFGGMHHAGGFGGMSHMGGGMHHMGGFH